MPTVEQIKLAELAGDVLKVLDKQREYFAAARKNSPDRSDILIVSKRMEQELRQKCTLILLGSGVKVKGMKSRPPESHPAVLQTTLVAGSQDTRTSAHTRSDDPPPYDPKPDADELVTALRTMVEGDVEW